jgi:hypothetical protein
MRAQKAAPAPAWAVALANAAVDDEPLSYEEALALEVGLSELNRQGVRLVSQSDIEHLIDCEAEA